MIKVWVSKDGTQVFREEPFGRLAETWGPFTTMNLVDETAIVLENHRIDEANAHLSEAGDLLIYDEDFAIADRDFFLDRALTYLAGYFWHVEQEDKVGRLAEDIERNSSLSVADSQALAVVLSESGWTKKDSDSDE